MIYDPSRAAQELRHRILETMTTEELEEYARLHRLPATEYKKPEPQIAGDFGSFVEFRSP